MSILIGSAEYLSSLSYFWIPSWETKGFAKSTGRSSVHTQMVKPQMKLKLKKYLN